jgi:undecaprenyl-diphosphatase
LTPIVKFITSLGNAGMIWIAITLILLIFKKTRKLGGICALSLISSLVINNFILKNLVARVRPYDQISALNLIIEKQKDWSFPSGHTGSSFACAGYVRIAYCVAYDTIMRALPKFELVARELGIK